MEYRLPSRCPRIAERNNFDGQVGQHQQVRRYEPLLVRGGGDCEVYGTDRHDRRHAEVLRDIVWNTAHAENEPDDTHQRNRDDEHLHDSIHIKNPP